MLTLGDKRISSVRVPQGWTVTLYRQPGFLDTAVHLVADASALGGFNHQTSSVVVNGGEGRLFLEWKTPTGLGYQPVPVANFKPAG